VKKGVCVECVCVCECSRRNQSIIITPSTEAASVHHQYCALQAGALRLVQLGGWQLPWWEGAGATQQ